MHAGDRNAILQAHQLGQHLRTLDHGNVQVMRFGDFRIFDGNGGTGHDDFGTGDVFRAMSFENDSAESRQPLGDGGTFQIRAGNFVAEIEQHLGDAAHADSADAHEMDTLNFGEHLLSS